MTVQPLQAFSHRVVRNLRLVSKDQGLAHRRHPLIERSAANEHALARIGVQAAAVGGRLHAFSAREQVVQACRPELDLKFERWLDC